MLFWFYDSMYGYEVTGKPDSHKCMFICRYVYSLFKFLNKQNIYIAQKSKWNTKINTEKTFQHSQPSIYHGSHLEMIFISLFIL